MIEFAQWKAELKMDSNGRVVVTRKLSVKKRDDPEGSVVMVVAPAMNGIVLQFESGGFHESESWVDKGGEYLECVEEGEMNAEDFCTFIDMWLEKKL